MVSFLTNIAYGGKGQVSYCSVSDSRFPAAVAGARVARKRGAEIRNSGNCPKRRKRACGKSRLNRNAANEKNAWPSLIWHACGMGTYSISKTHASLQLQEFCAWNLRQWRVPMNVAKKPIYQLSSHSAVVPTPFLILNVSQPTFLYNCISIEVKNASQPRQFPAS